MCYTFLYNFVFILAVAKAQLISSGLTCDDKRVIVNTHNRLREQIAQGKVKNQPKASNMQLMVWDDHLQTIAQAWADNMQIGHSKNRKETRFSTGENLMVIGPYLDLNITSKWDEVVTEWFNEHKLYKYQPFVKNKEVGHYTQVVWANTTYVGCGYSIFIWNGGPTSYYVCNYGPGGNYLGKYPYETGDGCDYLCCTEQCYSLYGNDCETNIYK